MLGVDVAIFRGKIRSAAWLVVGALAFAVLALVPEFPHGEQRLTLFASALALWIAWACAVPLILWLDQQISKAAPRWRRFAAHLAFLPLVFSFVAACRAGLRVAEQIGRWESLKPGALASYIAQEIVWELLTYSAILFAWTTYEAQQQLTRDALRVEVLERTLVEAQLKALRMQLDPHFLFNALNTISGYVDEHPAIARQILGHLGDLLRASLQPHSRQEVTLAEELELLDHYTAIQLLRFGNRLHICIDIADPARRALMPSFLLQPLVENAIQHGVGARVQGGTIQIGAQARLGDMLELRVADDGIGLPDGWSSEDHLGIGLKTTQERLSRLFGPEAHHLSIRRREIAGTEVTISIPLRYPEA